MSSSQCNYCSFEEMKRDAKKVGEVIITRSGNDRKGNLNMGGVNIYRIPKGEIIPKEITEEIHKKYWKCWYMALPDKCCC